MHAPSDSRAAVQLRSACFSEQTGDWYMSGGPIWVVKCFRDVPSHGKLMCNNVQPHGDMRLQQNGCTAVLRPLPRV